MVKKRNKKIKEKKSNPYILPVALILVLAVGVYVVKGGGNSPQPTGTSPVSTPPLTLVPVSLPDYAQQSKDTSDAYTIATQIPDVLEKMPCYCSCGASSGHKSLKDCYMDGDGAFISHGAYCQLCINEAYDTYEWYMDGVSIKEIRDRIDTKYGKGFGEPTDTPPV